MKVQRLPRSIRSPGAAVAAWARARVAPLAAVAILVTGAALLASDLPSKRAPGVDLPIAAFPGVESCCGAHTPLINVTVPAPRSATGAPHLRLGGKRLAPQQLATAFRSLARAARDPDRFGETAVLIRADRSAPWFHVQAVLAACAQPDVDLYRIQFQTRAPHPKRR